MCDDVCVYVCGVYVCILCAVLHIHMQTQWTMSFVCLHHLCFEAGSLTAQNWFQLGQLTSSSRHLLVSHPQHSGFEHVQTWSALTWVLGIRTQVFP